MSLYLLLLNNSLVSKWPSTSGADQREKALAASIELHQLYFLDPAQATLTNLERLQVASSKFQPVELADSFDSLRSIQVLVDF